MTRRRNKIIAIAVLAVAAIVLFKPLVGYQIANSLEKMGFPDVQLYVDEISTSGLKLKDIRIGNDQQLFIPEIEISYSLFQLMEERVQTVTVRGVYIDTHMVNNNISIVGLESVMKDAPPIPQKNATLFPKTLIQPDFFPFDSLKVENSRLHLLGYGVDATIPFTLNAQLRPSPHIDLHILPFNGKYNGYDFVIADSGLQAVLNEQDRRWQGQWQSESASVKGAPSGIPAFRVEGKLTATPEQFTSDISMTSDNSPVQVTGSMKASAAHSSLNLKSAKLPWGGGLISINDIALPVRENNILNTTIRVSEVSLNDVLKMLIGDKGKATGVISGELPIGINKDGSVIFYDGTLDTDKPGTISIDAAAIPSNNAQIDLLRSVMGNFHYNDVVMKVHSGEGNTLAVDLKVSGKNPDAYEGKPVKLNVHLTGDLLNVITQTVLPLTSPQELLNKKAP